MITQANYSIFITIESSEYIGYAILNQSQPEGKSSSSNTISSICSNSCAGLYPASSTHFISFYAFKRTIMSITASDNILSKYLRSEVVAASNIANCNSISEHLS